MKNIDIKVMERRIQTIIGNGKPSTLSKDFIQKKKEYLFNKFTPFVRNGIFALSDFEDTTKNEDEDDSPNAAFLKFIESNGGYLKRL